MAVGKRYRTYEGKGTSGDPTRPNTDALSSGGPGRSSVETPVMGVERRTWVILVYDGTTTEKEDCTMINKVGRNIPITEEVVVKA